MVGVFLWQKSVFCGCCDGGVFVNGLGWIDMYNCDVGMVVMLCGCLVIMGDRMIFVRDEIFFYHTVMLDMARCCIR